MAAAQVGICSQFCRLNMRGMAKATITSAAILGCKPDLLRLIPHMATYRRRRFKGGSPKVTISHLVPLPDHEPEGYLNQVAYAVPILAHDPLVLGGFVLASLATSKCVQLAMTLPGPLGGKGLQIAAVALGGCILVLFGLLASLRFPAPTQAERAIRRVKGMRGKDFVNAETWDMIFDRVLDEERFFVKLHFGAENDLDYY